MGSGETGAESAYSIAMAGSLDVRKLQEYLRGEKYPLRLTMGGEVPATENVS